MAVAVAERQYVSPSSNALQKKLSSSDVQGVGVLIVDSTGEYMLVANETQAKEASHRTPGQISHPIETVKRGPFGFGREPLQRTILGALAEVADDTTLPFLRRSFRLVQLPGGTTIQLTPTIRAHVAIARFDGSLDTPIWSPTTPETQNPHWVRVDDFLATDHARPFARQITVFARDNGYLEPTVLSNTAEQSPVQGMRSLEKFHARRERRADIPLVR